MILLSRHDYDAAVAAAEVEHLLARFHLPEMKHLVDDGFGSRIVRGEFFRRLPLLGRQAGGRQQQQSTGSIAHTDSSSTVPNSSAVPTVTAPARSAHDCSPGRPLPNTVRMGR